MNIKFKIISVDDTSHQIVVRYFSDIVNEEYLCTEFDGDKYIKCRTDTLLTLPLTQLSEKDLTNMILTYCNFNWFEREEKLINSKDKKDIDITASKKNLKKYSNLEGSFTKQDLEELRNAK